MLLLCCTCRTFPGSRLRRGGVHDSFVFANLLVGASCRIGLGTYIHEYGDHIVEGKACTASQWFEITLDGYASYNIDLSLIHI